MTAEPKKETTLPELESHAVTLAVHDKSLTDEIDALTEKRNKVRKERRGIEGKITTLRINAKA